MRTLLELVLPAAVLFGVLWLSRVIGAGLVGVAAAVKSGLAHALNPANEARLAALEVLVGGMRREVDRLPTIWKEERERMDRAAQRARVAADRLEAGARGEDREPDADPGDDAPDRSAERMQPVRAGVAPEPAQDRLTTVRRQLALSRIGRR